MTPELTPAIDVVGLACAYQEKTILEGVSFSVRPAEVFFIVGGTGVGKTTLLRNLVGLAPPAAGEVKFNGKSFTNAAPAERREMLKTFGMSFQGGALWTSLTLSENISLPLEEYTRMPADEIARIAAFRLSQVGLKGFEDYYPSEISGGMQKRAGIARALALDPTIVFFDEPSAGLDPCHGTQPRPAHPRDKGHLRHDNRHRVPRRRLDPGNRRPADHAGRVDPGHHRGGQPRGARLGRSEPEGTRIFDKEVHTLRLSADGYTLDMKTKISSALVGAFVLGAFAIGIITLLAVGSLSLFSKPERFMVYFDESVSGLDQGSPVKLRGVRVGHVVETSIRYDRASGKSLAAVLCELTRGAITDEHGAIFDVTDRAALQQLVDHGLRAQLELSGLATGLLYVELEFLDPRKYPGGGATDDKYIVVPPTPSEISELRASAATLLANATTVLAKMEQIDFQGLSEDLKKLAVEARQRIDGADFKGLVDQWKKTGASVDALARSPDALRAFDNLNQTLDQLRTTMGRLDTQVDSNGQELKATLVQAKAALESFNTAARSARGFIDAQQNFGSDTSRALEKVADAAESIQRLADFLERNPNAIVSGRKEPK